MPYIIAAREQKAIGIETIAYQYRHARSAMAR